MFSSNVQPVKKPKDKRQSNWLCPICFDDRPSYMVNCPLCYTKRPEYYTSRDR